MQVWQGQGVNAARVRVWVWGGHVHACSVHFPLLWFGLGATLLSGPCHVSRTCAQVPIIALLLPLAVLVMHKYTDNRTWADFWRFASALMVAVFLTAAITNCIKVAVGRPRPNFVVRCGTGGGCYVTLVWGWACCPPAPQAAVLVP